jgi:hypothetical protein
MKFRTIALALVLSALAASIGSTRANAIVLNFMIVNPPVGYVMRSRASGAARFLHMNILYLFRKVPVSGRSFSRGDKRAAPGSPKENDLRFPASAGRHGRIAPHVVHLVSGSR